MFVLRNLNKIIIFIFFCAAAGLDLSRANAVGGGRACQRPRTSSDAPAFRAQGLWRKTRKFLNFLRFISQLFFKTRVALPEATPSRFVTLRSATDKRAPPSATNLAPHCATIQFAFKKQFSQSVVSSWRYYNIFSISEKICLLNEKELKRRNFNDVRIITNWQEIVGEEFSGKLFPKQIKIIGENNKISQKILYCSTPDRRFANEFAFYKKDILDRLNIHFGGKRCVFVDVKINF